MRLRYVFLLILVAAMACSKSEPAKTYPLRGTIEGYDHANNSATIRHEEIPGYMPAMKMQFPVRGEKTRELPPEGSTVTATLHVAATTYWITDVKRAQ